MLVSVDDTGFRLTRLERRGGERDLCSASKRTLLSMRGCYLVTTITCIRHPLSAPKQLVLKIARKLHTGLRMWSVNNLRTMRCEIPVHDCGRRLDQRSFRSRAEVSFPRALLVSQVSQPKPTERDLC